MSKQLTSSISDKLPSPWNTFVGFGMDEFCLLLALIRHGYALPS